MPKREKFKILQKLQMRSNVTLCCEITLMLKYTLHVCLPFLIVRQVSIISTRVEKLQQTIMLMWCLTSLYPQSGTRSSKSCYLGSNQNVMILINFNTLNQANWSVLPTAFLMIQFLSFLFLRVCNILNQLFCSVLSTIPAIKKTFLMIQCWPINLLHTIM